MIAPLPPGAARRLPARSLHLATAAALALCLAACSKGDAAGGGGGRGRPPVAVTAGRAELRDVPVELRAVGSVEAKNTVSVRAQVGGVVTQVAFQEGEDVKRGDLLFRIDPRPYRAALAQAEANLARDAAKAVSAQADAERYGGLVDKDYVTKQQAQDMTATAAAAVATLRADSALVENARLDLAYCDIRAPIPGRTGSLLIHAGNVIKANDAALVVINQVTPALVSFSIPERELPGIRSKARNSDLPVQVVLPDSSSTLTGKLSFIDNAVDETTGTVLLKATFANEDRALWPGQFVDVSLRLGMEMNAVVVPSNAVQSGQDGSYVYVIKPDKTVDQRAVKVGSRVDGYTLIENGVQNGEEVVTDGQLRLVPGATVSIKTAPADTTAGAGA